MYYTVNVFLLYVMWDNESNWEIFEWNELKYDNTLCNMMGAK